MHTECWCSKEQIRLNASFSWLQLLLARKIARGQLKHDGWRAVDVDERPVQLLLQRQVPLRARDVDVLRQRGARC